MNQRTMITTGVALFAGILLGVGGAYVLMKRNVESSTAAGTQSADGRKVLYWHDPMVPGTKFDKPGKSPFMDMDLVPVYADSNGDSGISIPAAIAQNLGVRLGKVERRPFARSLNAVGSVAFDERRIEVVQSRVSGTISRLFVKAPLDHVRRGQPLAEVLSPEWLAAQQEYVALLDATSTAARDIRAAARERLIVLGVPETVIAKLEKERKADATTTIHAPIEGVIAKLDVREGSSFMAATPLMQINSLASVWVNAEIPESQVALASVGSVVTVNSTAWPGVSFEGRVIGLLPNINEQTRTLTARIEVRNREDKLIPGMYVTIKLASAGDEAQLVVPSEAVIVTGERSVVIVARDSGTFEVADVRTGAESQGYTTVLSGLDEGQSVVRSGQFLIDSEASLKAAVNRLETAAEPTTAHEPTNDTGEKLHLASGTITAISATDVTLAHGPVPSLNWPSMTMPFKLPAAGLPSDLKLGDHVTFSFAQSPEGGYGLRSIAKATEHTP
jgi:membrane fusion protein, copper/silver efflux system